ncbi:MAG: ATPase, T2SS/T4P/T4SS family [Oligoflexales bacterium]
MTWLHLFMHHFQHHPDLNEILVCGKQPIRLETSTQTKLRANPFTTNKSMVLGLYQFAEQQGSRLDYRQPFHGGLYRSKDRLFRWHAVVPPIADRGAIFSIRRQRFSDLDLSSFSMSDIFWKQILSSFRKKNHFLVIGATGSGKSSFLAAILKEFVTLKRTLILESLPELWFDNPHWISLSEKLPDLENKGAVTISQLFEQTLRLKPEVIVFGEIRSQAEWDTYIKARHTGHRTFATAHGHCRQDILSRFKTKSLSKTTIISLEKPRVTQVEIH